MSTSSSDSLRVLFHQVVLRPERLLEQPVAVQNRLLRMLRRHLLLGAVAMGLDEQRLRDADPRLRDLLDAARIHAGVYRRQLRWEVRQIVHALGDLRVPVVLLKGAAYDFLDLPNARGRWVSDVDILVGREHLERVEQALIRHGWQAMKLDEYDQGYYRDWMHELPPLRHHERGTVVDVHHAILPVTSRLKPDAAKLLAAAEPLAQAPLYVLSPADRVLHAAVHLFHDGDLGNGLRELYDLRALVVPFVDQELPWSVLSSRAGELGLEAPLYFALHHLHEQLGMEIPGPLVADLAGRVGVARRLADLMMHWQLAPVEGDGGGWRRRLAGELLYMRSHWLRMPPLMLARHLLTKARRRRAEERDSDPDAVPQ